MSAPQTLKLPPNWQSWLCACSHSQNSNTSIETIVLMYFNFVNVPVNGTFECRDSDIQQLTPTIFAVLKTVVETSLHVHSTGVCLQVILWHMEREWSRTVQWPTRMVHSTRWRQAAWHLCYWVRTGRFQPYFVSIWHQNTQYYTLQKRFLFTWSFVFIVIVIIDGTFLMGLMWYTIPAYSSTLSCI